MTTRRIRTRAPEAVAPQPGITVEQHADIVGTVAGSATSAAVRSALEVVLRHNQEAHAAQIAAQQADPYATSRLTHPLYQAQAGEQEIEEDGETYYVRYQHDQGRVWLMARPAGEAEAVAILIQNDQPAEPAPTEAPAPAALPELPAAPRRRVRRDQPKGGLGLAIFQGLLLALVVLAGTSLYRGGAFHRVGYKLGLIAPVPVVAHTGQPIAPVRLDDPAFGPTVAVCAPSSLTGADVDQLLRANNSPATVAGADWIALSAQFAQDTGKCAPNPALLIGLFGVYNDWGKSNAESDYRVIPASPEMGQREPTTWEEGILAGYRMLACGNDFCADDAPLGQEGSTLADVARKFTRDSAKAQARLNANLTAFVLGVTVESLGAPAP